MCFLIEERKKGVRGFWGCVGKEDNHREQEKKGAERKNEGEKETRKVLFVFFLAASTSRRRPEGEFAVWRAKVGEERLGDQTSPMNS